MKVFWRVKVSLSRKYFKEEVLIVKITQIITSLIQNCRIFMTTTDGNFYFRTDRYWSMKISGQNVAGVIHAMTYKCKASCIYSSVGTVIDDAGSVGTQRLDHFFYSRICWQSACHMKTVIWRYIEILLIRLTVRRFHSH